MHLEFEIYYMKASSVVLAQVITNLHNNNNDNNDNNNNNDKSTIYKICHTNNGITGMYLYMQNVAC